MTTTPTLAVGPFDLIELLGRGGMGEVWEARHRASGAPVAVKLLSGAEAARAEAFVAAFRNEVRLTLWLDHPHVVRVLDHGVVPSDVGHLVAHTPYLVMELGPRTTLSRHVGGLRWHAMRRVLDALLDALGHAHARGVVHRDVKPGNVLVDATVTTVKLTDFGLAHALEAIPLVGSRVFVGTPAFMAPEQFEGTWRDIGPWTDLYALGCLAYSLAAGAPPFGALTFAAGRAAHLGAEPPDLPAGAPVPAGFSAWVADLLAKDPGQRFQRAADARYALGALSDAVVDTEPLGRLEGEDTITLTSDAFATEAEDGGSPSGDWDGATTTTLLSAGLARPARPAPPLPEDWRTETTEVERVRLSDAGLRLIGLQPAPMVGRPRERDALWQALRETVTTRSPRAVLLPGPTGVGKLRLARWLGERSHELGSAHVLEARHATDPGPGHGVSGMLDRFLTCTGLDRQGTMARLRQIHAGLGVQDPEVALGLLTILRPDDSDATTSEADSRFADVIGFLERLGGSGRPLVILIDEAQVGTEPVAFASAVLEGLYCPALVLLTVTPELVEDSDVAVALDTLAAREDVSRVPLGPLSTPELEELLGWYGLCETLSSQLVDRSAGNPMYAVQLIGSWVERGLLEPSSTGLVLTGPVDEVLPGNLREVWVRRLDEVLCHCSETEQSYIERAAVLGPSVDHGDWDAVCRPDGAPLEVLEDLMNHQLAHPVGPKLGGGFAFAHPMLREALVARAQEHGRLGEHHEACVAWLAGRPAAGVSERLGRHLLGAGRPREALGPLLQAARERRVQGDTGGALGQLARRDQALERLGIPPSDRRWAPGWLERSRVHGQRGESEAMVYCLDRAGELARPGSAVAVDVKVQWCRELSRRGEHEAAWDVGAEALDLARKLGHRRLEAEAAYCQANNATWLGRLAEAEPLAQLARRLHADFRDPIPLLRDDRTLGSIAVQRGNLVQARQHFRRGLSVARRAGFARGRGRMLVSLGDVARYEGDLELASRYYGQAGRLFRRLGMLGLLVYVEHNVGLVALERGVPSEARPAFEAAQQLAARLQVRDLLADTHLALAACDVAAGQSSQAALGIREAMDLYVITGVADIDSVRLATTGADMAHVAGHYLREQEFLDVALHHARALGRDDKVAELDARRRPGTP